MHTKPVRRTKKTTQHDRTIQRLEQRILSLEHKLAKQGLHKEAKLKKNWIEWTTAFYNVAALIIDIPAIIAIIYEIVKLIFH